MSKLCRFTNKPNRTSKFSLFTHEFHAIRSRLCYRRYLCDKLRFYYWVTLFDIMLNLVLIFSCSRGIDHYLTIFYWFSWHGSLLNHILDHSRMVNSIININEYDNIQAQIIKKNYLITDPLVIPTWHRFYRHINNQFYPY